MCSAMVNPPSWPMICPPLRTGGLVRDAVTDTLTALVAD
jgi:hypothetical protein